MLPFCLQLIRLSLRPLKLKVSLIHTFVIWANVSSGKFQTLRSGQRTFGFHSALISCGTHAVVQWLSASRRNAGHVSAERIL
jgi:hypothetical protein